MPIDQFLINHGELVLFVAVLLNQLGIPVPAIPFLLASGSLVFKQQLNPVLVLSAALLACFIADAVWFYLGRWGGNRVLKLLCRISVEPDSCIRRTRNIFDRFGLRAILVAKFMPGLSAVVSPLVGSSGVSFLRYLPFELAGSLLYASAYLSLGAIFSPQLESLLHRLDGLGKTAFVVLAAIALGYIAFKFLQRKRLLRQQRMTRITVDELRGKQTAGELLAILDLRALSELAQDPLMISGASHVSLDEIDTWRAQIPSDREIVVYCSCPNEFTSARVASVLRRKGIDRVRPLLGGMTAWRERNYPTEAYKNPRAEAPGN